MIEWPINLAQGLQNRLVQDNISDPKALLDVYKSRKELLNFEFFDLFLPQQPGLLICLILFGILIAISAILFVVFCISRYLGICGSELYQKHPTKSSKFVALSIGFAINWILLAGLTAFIVTCILHLGNGGRSMLSDGTEEIPIQIQQLNKTNQGPVRIDFNTITITDIDSHLHAQSGEADVLNKYNAIRELGYEYKPMENDSDLHTQILLFSTLSFIYAAILAVTGTSMIIGCREYLYSYHPMDRSHNSNCVGRILVVSAMILLALMPLILLISTLLLAYIQADKGLCPYVQAQVQNQNMEIYTNSNFDYFDPYNLIEFLNDLATERNEINRYNCEVFIRPLQGIWISLIFLCIVALPTAIIILLLSKYFLRMSAANYYNPYNPTETYSTINEKSLPGTPFKAVFPSARY